MFPPNNAGRPEILKVTDHNESALVGRKVFDEMEQSTAIKSIQTSLRQMVVGKTISAKAVHQRLREL